MFPLVNLRGAGLRMQVWVTADVSGMVGLTDSGMLLLQWPGGDWAALGALSGNRVSGVVGPADQVAALRAAMDWPDGLVRHASDEPGYRLELRDLILPGCSGYSLNPLSEEVALMVEWRCAYQVEVFAADPDGAMATAARDVARWIAAGSHRMLRYRGAPVALSGFNAALPDVVQVGGVYVPPELRGRGHARRVVGLHLREARAAGVQRAVLFAANEAAARAYEALGFQPEGRMGLVLFASPQEVSA